MTSPGLGRGQLLGLPWLEQASKSSLALGWPPPGPLGLRPWAFILGFRPLSWWREVTWKCEKTDCTFSSLCQGTKLIVKGMFDAKANGTLMRRARRVSKKPPITSWRTAGPIAMRLADGLRILDGNHRIIAFCGLQEDKLSISGAILGSNGSASLPKSMSGAML